MCTARIGRRQANRTCFELQFYGFIDAQSENGTQDVTTDSYEQLTTVQILVKAINSMLVVHCTAHSTHHSLTHSTHHSLKHFLPQHC
jgi:hypothetical protein